MPEIPNVVGHFVGPLIWIGFIALMLLYGVWGAIAERRERGASEPPTLRMGDTVSRRGRSFATPRPRRRRPDTQPVGPRA